ncbi:hypothetical protein AAFF_G00353770 [Aldrovandia affinis]|uniref:Uncharacterized protein n=1 Tax=Aldrovandia affinis TaxID=143900 RepID=A0AAD7VZX5_9TELE|nr:hypothetical protein AAFF_G00353770 [Aldrovandia affinis]
MRMRPHKPQTKPGTENQSGTKRDNARPVCDCGGTDVTFTRQIGSDTPRLALSVFRHELACRRLTAQTQRGVAASRLHRRTVPRDLSFNSECELEPTRHRVPIA